MPQLLRFGPYRIYFWSNEGYPVECVHVHISDGVPSADATKVWITERGGALLANQNDKRIPPKVLAHLLEMIEAQSDDIIAAWSARFGSISYYC